VLRIFVSELDASCCAAVCEASRWQRPIDPSFSGAAPSRYGCGFVHCVTGEWRHGRVPHSRGWVAGVSRDQCVTVINGVHSLRRTADDHRDGNPVTCV